MTSRSILLAASLFLLLSGFSCNRIGHNGTPTLTISEDIIIHECPTNGTDVIELKNILFVQLEYSGDDIYLKVYCKDNRLYYFQYFVNTELHLANEHYKQIEKARISFQSK